MIPLVCPRNDSKTLTTPVILPHMSVIFIAVLVVNLQSWYKKINMKSSKVRSFRIFHFKKTGFLTSSIYVMNFFHFSKIEKLQQSSQVLLPSNGLPIHNVSRNVYHSHIFLLLWILLISFNKLKPFFSL